MTHVSVRCFFEGGLDAPDPLDLMFARVPMVGEDIDHDDRLWRVARVRWTVDGPMLTLSLLATERRLDDAWHAAEAEFHATGSTEGFVSLTSDLLAFAARLEGSDR